MILFLTIALVYAMVVLAGWCLIAFDEF